MGATTREVLLVIRAKNEAFRMLQDFGQAINSMNIKNVQSFRGAWGEIGSATTQATARQHMALASVGATVGVVATAIGHKITQAYVDASEATMEYESISRKTWQQVQDKAKVTLDDVKKIGEDVAGTWGFMTDDIQDSMFNVISSLDTDLTDSAEKVKGILDTIAEGSVAGFAKLDISANSLINTLNGFNMPASESRQILADMFGAAQRGKVDFEEFAGVIGRAIPSFNMLNQSADTMFKTIGFLTTKGLSPAMAATSASRMADAFAKSAPKFEKAGIQLIDPVTKKFKSLDKIILDISKTMAQTPEKGKTLLKLFGDMMKESGELSKFLEDNTEMLGQIGLKVKDLENLEPAQVMQKISEATAGMDAAQVRGFYDELLKGSGGTIQAMRALLNIMDDVPGFLDEMGVSAETNMQQYKEAIEIGMDDSARAFARAEQKFAASERKFGESILPLRTKINDVKIAFLDFFNSLPSAAQTGIAVAGLGFGGLLQVLGILTTAGSVLKMAQAAKALQSVATATQAIATASQAANAANTVGLITTLTGAAIPAKFASAAALMKIAGPAAVTATGATIPAAFGTTTASAGLGAAAGAGIGATAATIGGVVTAGVAAGFGLNWLIEKMMPGVNRAIEGVGGALYDFFAAIPETLESAGGGIYDFFASLPDKIGGGLSGIGNWFTKTLPDAVADGAAAAGDFLSSIPGKVSDVVAAAATGIVDYIKSIPVSIVEGIGFLYGFVDELVTEVLPQIPAAFVDVISDGWESFSTGWSNIWTSAKDWAGRVVTTTWEIIQQIPSAFVDTMQRAWNGFTTGFSNLVSTAWAKSKEIFSTVVNTIKELPGAFAQTMRDAWNNWTTGWRNLWNSAREWVGNVYNSVKSKLKELPGILKGIIDDMWSSVKNFASRTFNKIKDAFTRGEAEGRQVVTGSSRHTGGLILHAGGAVPSTVQAFKNLKTNERVIIAEVGEYMLNRRQVAEVGVPALEAWRTARMHDGGAVTPSLTPVGFPKQPAAGTTTLNIYGHQLSPEEIVDEVEWSKKTAGW